MMDVSRHLVAAALATAIVLAGCGKPEPPPPKKKIVYDLFVGDFVIVNGPVQMGWAIAPPPAPQPAQPPNADPPG